MVNGNDQRFSQRARYTLMRTQLQTPTAILRPVRAYVSIQAFRFPSLRKDSSLHWSAELAWTHFRVFYCDTILCWLHPLFHKTHTRYWRGISQTVQQSCLSCHRADSYRSFTFCVPESLFPLFIYQANESVNAKIDVWYHWSDYLRTVKKKHFSSFTFVLPMHFL